MSAPLPGRMAIGSRVSVRYRSPEGADKPLTDVIGHLEAVTPMLVIRTKSEGTVQVPPEAVVSVRELSHTPVRTSEIRALEHAAAMAWPGTENHWLAGWFLRAGHGAISRANSAVPLEFSAAIDTLPAIIDWYGTRGLPARLVLPERLLPVRAAGVEQTRILVCDVTDTEAAGVDLAPEPDRAWLATYGRDVPVDVLTAVLDGEVAFASSAGVAVGRGAVTAGAEGTRWVGISSVRVDPARRRQGHARRLCAALLAWGAARGARRAYAEVLADDAAANALYTSMGFRLHHRRHYVDAQSLLAHRI